MFCQINISVHWTILLWITTIVGNESSFHLVSGPANTDPPGHYQSKLPMVGLNSTKQNKKFPVAAKAIPKPQRNFVFIGVYRHTYQTLRWTRLDPLSCSETCWPFAAATFCVNTASMSAPWTTTSWRGWTSGLPSCCPRSPTSSSPTAGPSSQYRSVLPRFFYFCRYFYFLPGY